MNLYFWCENIFSNKSSTGVGMSGHDAPNPCCSWVALGLNGGLFKRDGYNAGEEESPSHCHFHQAPDSSNIPGNIPHLPTAGAKFGSYRVTTAHSSIFCNGPALTEMSENLSIDSSEPWIRPGL